MSASQKIFKETGFQLCEFVSDGDEICNICNHEIKKGGSIYYESCNHECDEGEYYCTDCALDTPKRWQQEADSISEWFNQIKQ